MNSKAEQSAAQVSGGDIAKYVLAVLVAAAGIAGFYLLPWPGPIRGLVAVLGVLAGLGIFALTVHGRRTWDYLGEARFELRKVVWPTRQETGRMTLVVFVVVVIVTILIGIIDFFISGGMRLLLGN
ncbi:preprotein translocase subunit SecE [Coralloluteibacterium thermophilus]|uniref:Protein translocase subunit SecE n=1 Tax=Coralloluteibacterium thermophilum TaxID=2707049 RepID=A0ABV9NRT5_9GAMM